MTKCTRCGKERIVESSYAEKLEKTTVFYTVTVCPDPDCQKLVEVGLLAEENRRRSMSNEQGKRGRRAAGPRFAGQNKTP